MDDRRIDHELGRRIREARQRLDLTQRDLGAALGVTAQQVQKYEAGKSQMSVGMLLKFAEAVKATPATLLAGLGPAELDTKHLTPAERDLIGALRSLPQREVQFAIVSLTQALAAAASAGQPSSRRQRS